LFSLKNPSLNDMAILKDTQRTQFAMLVRNLYQMSRTWNLSSSRFSSIRSINRISTRACKTSIANDLWLGLWLMSGRFSELP
jgi:superfamily II RNA helicase